MDKAAKAKGQAWFNSLEPFSFQGAQDRLEPGDVVRIMRGPHHDYLTRTEALSLLQDNAARAPDGQTDRYKHFRLVTLDEDGLPIQLRTH